MRVIITMLLSILFSQIISAQETDSSIKHKRTPSFLNTNKIRIGYGPVLAGKGDLIGHKFMLGGQYFLTKLNAFDYRLSGTLIDVMKNFENNPDWSFYQVSNGIELVLEYNFVLQYKKLRFYPSIGPALRYSYERHSYSYGIRYNRTTQNYDWFCDIDENTGFRIGYEFGLNADFTLFNYFTIGPRFSFSNYPAGGYTFAFLGFTLIAQHL